MITFSNTTPRADRIACAIRTMQEQLGPLKGPTHEFYRKWRSATITSRASTGRPDVDEGRLIKVRWRLNEDGGGTAYFFLDFGIAVHEQKVLFESLDGLGASLSSWIREDGRVEGELPVPPYSN